MEHGSHSWTSCPPRALLPYTKKNVCLWGSNIRSQKQKEIATYTKNSAMIEFNDQSTRLVESLRVSLTSQLIKIMGIMSECSIFAKYDDGMSWEYAVFWTYIKYKNTIVTFWGLWESSCIIELMVSCNENFVTIALLLLLLFRD